MEVNIGLHIMSGKYYFSIKKFKNINQVKNFY